MIKGKGKIQKIGGVLKDNELKMALAKLPDNQDYDFLIYDHKANRLLPYLNYLFSVVLKQISDQLPNHPSTHSLYKYFEERFAPEHTCVIDGQKFSYFDLKGEKSTDFCKVVENIVEYVQKNWNITVTSREELTAPEYRDFCVKAYANLEIDWNRFISSRNK